MDKYFQFETITIYFPDAVINEFWFRIDAAEQFNTETTEKAVRLIKRRMKEQGLRSVFVDPESDSVSFSSKDGKKIFKLASIINNMISPVSDSFIEHELLFKKEMKNYVPKKGQTFTIGDLVSVPLKDVYGVMQIIDQHEGAAICILFETFFTSEDELQSCDVNLFTSDNVFAAIGLQDWYLTDYTLKVIRKNLDPLARVIYNNRRNRLIEESVPDIVIERLFEDQISNVTSDLLNENVKKLKNIEWVQK